MVGVAGQHLLHVIGRTVREYDQFKVGMGLTQDILDRVGEKAGMTENGEDDTDEPGHAKTTGGLSVPS
jgi:hypothetical protein